MLNFFNGVSIESGKISPLSNFFELMSQKQSSQAILFSLSILLVFSLYRTWRSDTNCIGIMIYAIVAGYARQRLKSPKSR